MDREEREELLREREALDLRALLDAPAVEFRPGQIVWCAIRRPEKFECDVTPAHVVVVMALTGGIILGIERYIFRRRSGEALPIERDVVANLYETGELEFVQHVPRAQSDPETGIKLRASPAGCPFELEEATGPERHRVYIPDGKALA